MVFYVGQPQHNGFWDRIWPRFPAILRIATWQLSLLDCYLKPWHWVQISTFIKTIVDHTIQSRVSHLITKPTSTQIKINRPITSSTKQHKPFLLIKQPTIKFCTQSIPNQTKIQHHNSKLMTKFTSNQHTKREWSVETKDKLTNQNRFKITEEWRMDSRTRFPSSEQDSGS